MLNIKLNKQTKPHCLLVSLYIQNVLSLKAADIRKKQALVTDVSHFLTVNQLIFVAKSIIFMQKYKFEFEFESHNLKVSK